MQQALGKSYFHEEKNHFFLTVQKNFVNCHTLKILWIDIGNAYFQFSQQAHTTNQKGQMLPRRLFTLNRGIQIRGQPIKKYKKNFDFDFFYILI